MNSGTGPILINSKSICVIDSTPVEARIIQLGNLKLCQDTLRIFDSNVYHNDEIQKNQCGQCESLKKEIELLKIKNLDYEAKSRNLLKKCDEYKKYSDKYKTLMIFIKNLNLDNDLDESPLLDSNQDVCIDLKYPAVTISKSQINQLESIKTCGATARALMDMLFEHEAFEGKNFTKLESEYPEKIGAIQNYCINKFKVGSYKVTKAITGKCHGT